MPKKRNAVSAFESVANLELEDKTAEKLRRKQSVKDVTRAKAARSQTKIYGNLMETRILLQRTLQQALTYSPEQEAAAEDSDSNDDDDDQPQSTSTLLADECDDLLEKLLQARRQTVTGLEEPSDSDDLDADDVLQSEYQTCRKEWMEVLNPRHQDLRLHAGLGSSSKTQFRVLDSSFWQQVESTVNHEEMRQRTTNHDSTAAVYDDSKVYQHMLKDFLVIASNTTAAGDANTSQSYQRWKSPHAKKQVDRKASKGRKIRYVEIPKLVNFTFPISRTSTSNHTNLDADEWFQSLFGGGRKRPTTSGGDGGGAIMVSSGDAGSD